MTRNARARPAAADDPLEADQYYLDAVRAPAAWRNYAGRGVLVAVIDDGVQAAHPDLRANFDPSLSFDARTGGAGGGPPGYNDDHGTLVAGIIAAADNGVGIKGVAHGADFGRIGIPLDGVTPLAVSNTRAIEAAGAADVVNNSYGYIGSFVDDFNVGEFAALGDAIASVAAEGRGGLGSVMVVAGGNGRTEGDDVNHHNLLNNRHSIAVAATDPAGDVAGYSSPGAPLLVSAPGENILSTDLLGPRGVPGDYAPTFGTSFAAPIVSGVAALMLEANPRLGYRDVQEILAYSADPPDASAGFRVNGATNWNGGGLRHSLDVGFGLVNAHDAVRLAESWTRTSTSANEAVVAASAAPGRTIPDGGSTAVALTLPAIEVEHVEVDLTLSHARPGDLIVRLVSPDGTASRLLNRPGDGDEETAPDSGNGTYATPVTNGVFTLASVVHWGEFGAGPWRLVVEDARPGRVGRLEDVEVRLYGDRPSPDDVHVYTDAFARFGAEAGRSTLRDFGGTDLLNAAALTDDVRLLLGQGRTSVIAGRTLLVPRGTLIENAVAGDGGDLVTGNALANRLDGARGNDRLAGGAGDDRLIGGAGRDSLAGDAGADLVIGGAGADRLTGGGGADTFYVYRSQGGDTVTDLARGDRLILGDVLDAGGPDDALRLVARAGGTAVRFDADGAGGAGFTDLVTLAAAPPARLDLTADGDNAIVAFS